MRVTKRFLLAVTLAIGANVVAAAAMAQTTAGSEQQKKSAELLEIIKADGLTAAKAAAFEELAVFGTGEVVPVLAPMLSDGQLAHYARFALESNPDPAVDQAFRDALQTLKGDLLVGVINSIGVRKDAGSLSALEQLLTHDSPQVVGAAAAALGAIATPEAAQLLTKALAGATDSTLVGIARGCLLYAENAWKAGQLEKAVMAFDLVRAAAVPKSVQLAGLRGAILARQSAGVALMVEQLESGDRDAVHIALRAARELDDPAVRTAIVATIDRLDESTATSVLLALGDIGDRSTVSVLAKAADAGTPGLRLAAIKSLSKVGDSTAVPALWKAALAADPALSEWAFVALAAIPGEKTDAAIVAGLDSENAAKRKLALELIASRRIAAAVPRLLTLAEGSDDEARLLAISALGETAPQEKLSTLIGWVISADDDAAKATCARALQAACARLPDRDTCAKQLTSSLASASNEAKTTLLEQLGAMGGPDALQCLADCAKDSSPDTQDAATRILGTWVGADVGPVLLDLARTIENDKYKIRVLRGYVRIASQFGLPHDDKMAMCQNALDVAQRNDERELVLKVLERNPSPTSLGLTVTLLDNAELKNQAANVALKIAQRLIVEEPKPVADAMQKVIAAGVSRRSAERAQGYLEQAK